MLFAPNSIDWKDSIFCPSAQTYLMVIAFYDEIDVTGTVAFTSHCDFVRTNYPSQSPPTLSHLEGCSEFQDSC